MPPSAAVASLRSQERAQAALVLASTLTLLLLLTREARSQEVEWDELGPPVRAHHSMVLDTREDRLLVFGGTPDEWNLRNDVWTIDLDAVEPAWRRLEVVGTPPSPRQEHSAVFDSLGNRMIVFGGTDRTQAFGDLWVLELSGVPRWTKIDVAGPGPSARWGAGAVWDPVDHRTLVVGGRTHGTFPKDAWKLDLSVVPTWTPFPIEPHVSYPIVVDPQSWGGAGYDPVSGRVFINGSAGLQAFDLHASEPRWSCQGIGGGNAPLTVDILGRRVIQPGSYGLSRFDMWEGDGWLSLGLRTSLGPSTFGDMGPRSEEGQAVVYDARRHRCFVFGGVAYVNQHAMDARLWALDLAAADNWTVIGERTPRRSSGPVFVHDTLRDRAIYWSMDSYGAENDFRVPWTRGLGQHDRWIALTDSAGASALGGPSPSTVYDPVRDRLVVFEGTYGGAAQLAQVPLHGALVRTPIPFTGPTPPAGESAAGAAYDPIEDRLVVFAPRAFGVEWAQVWAISLSGTASWSRLDGPAPRPAFGTQDVWIHDPLANCVYLIGASPTSPSWSLDLDGSSAWAPFAPGNRPDVIFRGKATFDAVRHRAVLFTDEGTWALELAGAPEWRSLDESGPSPSDPGGASGFYDPARDRIFVYSLRSLHSLSFADAATAAMPMLLDAGADENGIQVRWSVSDALDPCDLERSESGAIWTLRARLTPDGAGIVAFTDDAVVEGVEYAYRLRIPTREGFVITEPVAIVARGVIASAPGFIALHPNPSVGPVTVEWSATQVGDVDLEIFDLRGRRVHHATLAARAGRNAWSLPLGDLPAGLFAVRLRQGADLRVARLVRVR